MDNDPVYKSKTQIKKEAEALQKLGEALVKLPDRQLDGLDLPEKLRTALADARSITSHVAARRQRQYIGALMRDIDPVPIRLALSRFAADPGAVPVPEQQTSEWEQRLLSGGAEDIEAFLEACPGLERQRLRQLLRNIKKEKKPGKPSKSLARLRQMINDVTP